MFDLALFSIPLFLVDAPGAWSQRALVIAAAARAARRDRARRRAQAGAWGELPASLRNGAWQPPRRRRPRVAADARRASADRARAALVQRALPVLGLAGLVAWVAFTPLHADVPPLALDRARRGGRGRRGAARSAASTLGPEWRRFSTVRRASDEAPVAAAHVRLARGGPAAYRALVGNALAPPLWDVRFARFDGDVAERAEEWRVTVDRRRHACGRSGTCCPRRAPGARLARDAALALARAARCASGSALDPAALHAASRADETKRPARTDWTFTFADPRVDVGKGGEARMQVALAGDEVASAGRFVYVPEAWQRAERERDGRLQIAKIAAALAVRARRARGARLCGAQLERGHCDTRALLIVGALAFAAAAIDLANGGPTSRCACTTTEPVLSQVATPIAGGLFAGAVRGAASWRLAVRRRLVERARTRPDALADAAAAVGRRCRRRRLPSRGWLRPVGLLAPRDSAALAVARAAGAPMAARRRARRPLALVASIGVGAVRAAHPRSRHARLDAPRCGSARAGRWR